MEPVTHLLTGACLARAGLNRKTAYATVAMTIAAEVPDLDVLWSIRGPVAELEHHRGWTHTFLGVPLEAAVVVGAVWLWHRWRIRREQAKPETARRKALPPRWWVLYGCVIVALLSHILLDWTNNYGVRPFFPFNPRWYAGSFVFIFEPVMFLLLLAGLVAPALFGLINGEVGAQRERFRGRGWAIFSLAGVALLWGWRGWERMTAERLALSGDFGGVPILRSTVCPYPVTPYTWHAVIETGDAYQLATVDTWAGTVATSLQEDLLHKQPVTLATLRAKQSWLGRVYLDWSQFPLVTDGGPSLDGVSEVTFRDLRFMYDVPFLHGRESPPLTGVVKVNANRAVVSMEMDNQIQH